MWIREILLAIAGLSAGVAVAGGLFSFIVELGVIADFADRTHTGDKVCFYEDCAALGGMVMLANYNSARADYGTVYTLQCVLIVVLGGVNPNGGSGKVSGVVLAICLLQMLQTGINRFPQISSYYISLIWGGVLILVMVLNYFTEHNIHLIKSRRS